jgi:hypothetical protein
MKQKERKKSTTMNVPKQCCNVKKIIQLKTSMRNKKEEEEKIGEWQVYIV